MAKRPDTSELLHRTAAGDGPAREALLARHRSRLRQMIAYRLDRRIASRVDPSDVVQEVLVEASRRLPEYLDERPLPFYPWLRQIACDRLIALYRSHVRAERRSVCREEPDALSLPDESAAELASRLVTSTTNPSQRLVREESRALVRSALQKLPARHREVLELRHLEQLSVAETAAVLGISEGAVKNRHMRALQRLRDFLQHLSEGNPS